MKAASSDRVTRLSAAAADTVAAAKAKERDTSSNEVKDDAFVFGQNAFKAHDKNKKFKPGKQKIKDMIDNDGEYRTSGKFECKGREHGLTKCHPVCAFAHTQRHIMVKGKWMWVNLCAPCEAELFHQVEQFNYTEDIVKKQTEQTFAWEVEGKEESEMKITICGGNPNILKEFIPGQFLVRYPTNDNLNCGPEYLTPESLKDQINNLISKKIFVQHFNQRGLFSSGLVAARTMEIMEGEKVFKSILDYFGGRDYVRHVWCQLASKDAFQQFHADSFQVPSAHFRHVWNIGCHDSGEIRKMMTITNRKTGMWCSFLVPHGAVVSMSTKLAGNLKKCKHWQHRIDFSDGVFAVVVETSN